MEEIDYYTKRHHFIISFLACLPAFIIVNTCLSFNSRVVIPVLFVIVLSGDCGTTQVTVISGELIRKKQKNQIRKAVDN